jgi:LmbE family N-acetylglucosaminyl deacetylase
VTDLSVLAVFAHPDDETILAGGILTMLVDHGATLHLLLATRGEGGELGEPALTERSQLGIVREAELHCAAEKLGAESILIMDYIDPLVGQGEALYPFEAEFEGLAQEIGAARRATQADVLITHGSNGEYGHPAHVLMHRATKFALQSDTGSSIPLYSISADFPDHPRPRLANNDDPADFIVDIEPWLPTKLKAAECHRTQGALFVRRSSQEAGRTLKLAEVLMKVESLHRSWPPLNLPMEDRLAWFLRKSCGRALIFDGLNDQPGLPRSAD